LKRNHSLLIRKSKRKDRVVFKAISFALAVSFLLQDIVFADPDLKPISWQWNNEAHASKRWAKSLLPNLPESVVVIEDAWKAPVSAGKLVYLIQDAHTNTSGQLNSAKTLDYLFHNSELKYIFLEAGSGNESLSFLRKYASLEKRKQVAESFLRQGKLQGTEYLDLTSDHSFTLWGVEDLGLYGKSVSAYGEVVKNRKKFEGYLLKIETAVKVLKPKIYNPFLFSFDEKYQKFQSATKASADPSFGGKGEMSLTDYFSTLTFEAQKHSIPLSAYPSLTALNKLKELESKIDFKKANQEQQKAIQSLSPEDQKELLASSQIAFKLGNKDNPAQKAFFALLEEKLSSVIARSPKGDEAISVAKIASLTTIARNDIGSLYPNLSQYLSYLKASKQIDPKAILEEQTLLEKEVFRALSTNHDEESLIMISKDLECLRKLLNLTLTPNEYEEYRQNKKAFDITLLTGFLNKKMMELKDYHDKAVFLESGYEAVIKRAEEFYELTYQRDRAFVKNMLDKMEGRASKNTLGAGDAGGEASAARSPNESYGRGTAEFPQAAGPAPGSGLGSSTVVLITGGYHTPNLKYLLKKKNISYIVLTPQIFHETNQKRYESILLNQFAGEHGSAKPYSVLRINPLTGTNMPMRSPFGPQIAAELGVPRFAPAERVLGRREAWARTRVKAEKIVVGPRSGARLAFDQNVEKAVYHFEFAAQILGTTMAYPEPMLSGQNKRIVLAGLLNPIDSYVNDLKRVREILEGQNFDSPTYFPEEVLQKVEGIKVRSAILFSKIKSFTDIPAIVLSPNGLEYVQDEKSRVMRHLSKASDAIDKLHAFLVTGSETPAAPFSGARLAADRLKSHVEDAQRYFAAAIAVIEPSWTESSRWQHLITQAAQDPQLLEQLYKDNDRTALVAELGGHIFDLVFLQGSLMKLISDPGDLEARNKISAVLGQILKGRAFKPWEKKTFGITGLEHMNLFKNTGLAAKEINEALLTLKEGGTVQESGARMAGQSEDQSFLRRVFDYVRKPFHEYFAFWGVRQEIKSFLAHLRLIWQTGDLLKKHPEIEADFKALERDLKTLKKHLRLSQEMKQDLLVRIWVILTRFERMGELKAFMGVEGRWLKEKILMPWSQKSAFKWAFELHLRVARHNISRAVNRFADERVLSASGNFDTMQFADRLRKILKEMQELQMTDISSPQFQAKELLGELEDWKGRVIDLWRDVGDVDKVFLSPREKAVFLSEKGGTLYQIIDQIDLLIDLADPNGANTGARLALHDDEADRRRMYLNMLGALKQKDAPRRFWSLARQAEGRGYRWALVGKMDFGKRQWRRAKRPRIYSHRSREEIFQILTSGISFTSPFEIQHIKRSIDSLILAVPNDKVGILFMNKFEVNDGPYYEIAVSPDGHTARNLMHTLSYGFWNAGSYAGDTIQYFIPAQASRGQPAYPVEEKLRGGSYSDVTRLHYADGTSAVVKKVDPKKDGGKLYQEAVYMQNAPPAMAKKFPRIHEIIHTDSETRVEMEDLRDHVEFSDIVFSGFDSRSLREGMGFSARRRPGGQELFEIIQRIYASLVPHFYSKVQTPVPADFTDRAVFAKLDQRWKEAAERSALIRRLLEAPFVEVRHSFSRGEFYPNLFLMKKILLLMARTYPSLFLPPYLSHQHGDLHLGNILIDPFYYFLDGDLSTIKLIDPKYIPEGNDPLYDFAKLTHNLYGGYDLALHHSEDYHFDIHFENAPQPHALLLRNYNDEDEETERLLYLMDDFAEAFGRFIQDREKKPFPFEKNNDDWRSRLLFTQAALIAGLLPFHTVGDDREERVSVLYEVSVDEFYRLIGLWYRSGGLKPYPELQALWGILEFHRESEKDAGNVQTFSRSVELIQAYVDKALDQAGPSLGARLAVTGVVSRHRKIQEPYKTIIFKAEKKLKELETAAVTDRMMTSSKLKELRKKEADVIDLLEAAFDLAEQHASGNFMRDQIKGLYGRMTAATSGLSTDLDFTDPIKQRFKGVTGRYTIGNQTIGTRDRRFFELLPYIEKDLPIPAEKRELSPRTLTKRGVLTIASIQDKGWKTSRPMLFTAMPGFETATPVIERVGPGEYDILIELTSRITGRSFVASRYALYRGRFLAGRPSPVGFYTHSKSALVREIMDGILHNKMPDGLRNIRREDVARRESGFFYEETIFFWKGVGFFMTPWLRDAFVGLDPAPWVAPDAWVATLYAPESARRPSIPVGSIVLYANGRFSEKYQPTRFMVGYQNVIGDIPNVKHQHYGDQAKAHWNVYWLARGGEAPAPDIVRVQKGRDPYLYNLSGQRIQLVLGAEFRKGRTVRYWTSFPELGDNVRGVRYVNERTKASVEFVLYSKNRFLKKGDVAPRPSGARLAGFKDLRFESLRHAIQSSNNGPLIQIVKNAGRSELDFLLFRQTFDRLVIQNKNLYHRFFSEKLSVLLKSLGEDSRFFFTGFMNKYPLGDRALLEHAKAASRFEIRNTGLRQILFDDTFMKDRNGLPLGPLDIDVKTSRDLVEKLLSQTGKEDFLLATVRDISGDAGLKENNLAPVISVLKFQEGKYQRVYFVSAFKKNGEAIAFALLLAKDAGGKSEVVRREYKNLFAHRGEEEFARVSTLGSVAYERGSVAAYSSEFHDNFSEVLYFSMKTDLGEYNRLMGLSLEQAGRSGAFWLNSSLPARAGIFSDARSRQILEKIIEIFVRLYEPEKKTMIDLMQVGGGDFNIYESIVPSWNGRDESYPFGEPKELKVKLIAWRGDQENVEPYELVRHLFGLKYLFWVRREVLKDELIPPFVIEGVLEGLKRGLVKRHGKIEGLKMTKRYLQSYLRAVRSEEVERSPIFPAAVIHKFIRGLDLREPRGSRLAENARLIQPEALVNALYDGRPINPDEVVTFLARVYGAGKRAGDIAVGDSVFRIIGGENGDLSVFRFGKLLGTVPAGKYKAVEVESQKNKGEWQVTFSMSDFKRVWEEARRGIKEAPTDKALNSRKAVGVIDLEGLNPNIKGFDEVSVPILIREINLASKEEWGKNAKFLLKGDQALIDRIMPQLKAFYSGTIPDFIITDEKQLDQDEEYAKANRIFITVPNTKIKAGDGQRFFFIQAPREGDVSNFYGSLKGALSIGRLSESEMYAGDKNFDDIRQIMKILLGYSIGDGKEFVGVIQGKTPTRRDYYALPPIVRLPLNYALQGARLAVRMLEQAA